VRAKDDFLCWILAYIGDWDNFGFDNAKVNLLLDERRPSSGNRSG
jgi:hypothetical protein